RERYERLFDLAVNKSITVADMCSLGWEAGGDAQSSDSWQWQLDLVRGYTVHGACHLLTSQQHVTFGTSKELIWHKQVLLKVSILAWRLLYDRLPTKTNLVTRGIITPGAHL
ncbi:cysteine-rich receptor-like protein kinase, partial [Trifolium medium]|nr:cysteine-rich receptor-like protein kinase [Trifolium medium]